MHGIFLSAFVNSNFLDASFNRPLGPYRIASFLRNNNYDIQVIEFAHLLTDDQIYKLIEKFITPETKFIGLGLMIYYKHGKWIQCINKFARVMTSLKEKYPNVKIIVGGSTGFIGVRDILTNLCLIISLRAMVKTKHWPCLIITIKVNLTLRLR
jgi:hypothetical protein